MIKNKILTKLINWSEKPVPKFIKELPEEQLVELEEYINAVVAHENSGLDDLFQGMSQTMKYIPTFIIVKMSVKFLKPALASRVTAKIPLKEAIKLSPQLPVEYACEVGYYLDSQLAADIYGGLKLDHCEKLLKYMFGKYPAKALDIGQHLDDKLMKKMAGLIHGIDIDSLDPILEREYQHVLDRLFSFA